jgi:hypothetical protein
MKMGLGAKIGIFGGILGGVIGMVAAIISEPILGSIFSAFFIVVFGTVFWKIFRPMYVSKKLLKTGVRAKAIIVKVWDTGVTVNKNPQVGLLLDVTPPHKMPYQTEMRQIISRLNPSVYQPGMEVDVRIDPDDEKKIAIESIGGAGGYSSSYSKSEAEKKLMEVEKLNKEILKYGESSRAIVLNYTEMGINVNGNNPAVTLDLEVIPDNRKSFKAQAKGIVMETSVPKFQPGEEIYVKFDPKDITKVSIEHS